MSNHPSVRDLVNVRLLVRMIGLLLVIESVFMLAPLCAAILYQEDDAWIFGGSTAVTALVGVLTIWLSRPTRSMMGKRDGFLLISLVWIVFAAFGMLPFVFGSPHMAVVDAWFEAMSGFTTTGASVIADIDSASHGVLLWRSMMQWIGGMGIILFTLAVLPMFNQSGSVQLFNAEVTGITHDKIRPRIGQTAKTLWLIYAILTCTLLALLWAGPMDFFDSMCHSLSTLSTGGFSTRAAGIMAWDSTYLKVVMTLFMFVGGVNFVLIYNMCTGNPGALRHNNVFRAFCLTVAVIWAMFVASVLIGGHATDVESAVIDTLFQVVSFITSTGYICANYEAWGTIVLVLLIVMMFTGSCAGSTSGGSKIDRTLVVMRLCHNEIYRCIRPNAIRSVRLNGRIVNHEATLKVASFMCLYVMMIGVGVLILSVMGISASDALVASISCAGNTGVGIGPTGINGSFAMFPALGKIVLTLIMLVGRLEIFTVLVLLSPSFWRR